MTTGNTIKTVVLLAALTALLIFVGRILGGVSGMWFAFFFAVVINFGSYWWSDKIALSMARARQVSPAEAPELHSIVDELTTYARMPKPRVYVVDSPSPNAFATGRDPSHAAVAVTSGILRTLNRQELAGVIAHELAHVRNRDTLIAAVAATIAGAITMLAQFARFALIFGGFRRGNNDDGLGDALVGLLMIIVAPIAALIIQLAISRAREFSADATGARMIGSPDALADALEKLEAGVQARPMTGLNPSVSPLFIVNPFRGASLSNLFSTHPPIAERVARLRQMALEPTAYGMGF